MDKETMTPGLPEVSELTLTAELDDDTIARFADLIAARRRTDEQLWQNYAPGCGAP